MSCQCKCKPLALSQTESAEGVMTWDSPKCFRMLRKPVNPSILLFDQSGKVVWRDGSESLPIRLPSLKQGNTLSAQYLVTYDESGALERVPVTPVDITICPEVGDPYQVKILAIPQ